MHTLCICMYNCVYVFITVGPLQQPPPVPARRLSIKLRPRAASGIAYVTIYVARLLVK